MTRIYLVEDDATTREELREVLASLDAEVVCFEAAEPACEAVLSDPPDLLVTDVMLGVMTGVELTHTVRERFGRLDLPVMIVSAAEELDDLSRAYEAGADDYLVKPIDAGELRAKARLLLERAVHRRAEETAWQRYELLDQLGKGQTGTTTYRAKRLDDGSELALKLVDPRAGPAITTALLAEAELLRGLADVPGIVQVRDLGQDGGCTYYAMDLVAGPTLRADLDERVRLDTVQVADLGRGLGIGLASLAERGVTHGDVKPANVILTEGGPVLVDFGLARRRGEEAPRERGGTLTYLAPEVVRGEEITPRSDVYSLGVVLFEAFTGRLPYEAIGADLAAKKVEGLAPQFEPLLALDPPPGLVAVIEAALEPDPARRTTQAGELAMAMLPYGA